MEQDLFHVRTAAGLLVATAVWLTVLGCGGTLTLSTPPNSPTPLPTPSISPLTGTYTSTLTVTITDPASASIYYTTNGSTPSSGSLLYTGPITVSTSETVKAIAVASGSPNSAVASATYTINSTPLPTPSISPASGNYTSAQTVTITDTVNASIYYTTNGSTPSAGSLLYSGPITVSSSETVKAIAIASGAPNSAVASATYTINSTPLPTPSISPASGSYTSAQTVTITDTVNASIYYTTNGSTPSSGSLLYSGPITVSSSETLEAIAVASGSPNSAVASATYIINLTPPSISAVQVVCSPAVIAPSATSTCAATVSGQGNYSKAVSWSVNVGQVSNGTFTPSGVERATVTATSVQDPTKSASFVVAADISWSPGTMAWGADGRNSIGTYYNIPLSTQIADLKAVFGTSANTYILYRAWNYESGVASSDLITAQESGIIPLVGFATYPSYDMTPTTCGNSTQQPGWASWYTSGGEAEAYRWSYCRAQQAALDLPTNLYWYVGNEWIGDNYGTLPTACQNAPVVTGTTPAAWEAPTTGDPCYPLYRGVLAGSIAGLQDSLGYVRIIPDPGGANGSEGLAAALATDLANPKGNLSGRSLSWDFTSIHWGSDAVNNANGICADNAYFDEGPLDAYFLPSGCLASWSSTVNRDFYATVGLAGKPLIVTEISSSDGESAALSASANAALATANDALVGNQITGILDNLKAHTFAINGEQGVVGGLLYELYQEPGNEIDRFLYTYQSGTAPGPLSAQGVAVQSWIQRNGNPTVMSSPIFNIKSSPTSATTVSVGGSITASISLTPSSFGGLVSLSYRVWAIQPNAPNLLPACTFSNLSVGASSPVTMNCSAQPGLPSGTYVVSVYGTNGPAVAPANFTFTVQ